MIATLRPQSLVSAASQLGIHPFELVRLRLAREESLDSLAVEPDQIEHLRTFGGIETWWASTPSPDAAVLLRKLLGHLLDRGLVGTRTTRLDNLWRGLEVEAADALQAQVPHLRQAGWLVTQPTPTGVRCSLVEEATGPIRSFANGGSAPAALAHLETP